MSPLFTQFKNALGSLVGYAEIELGLDTNGVPKRIPQSAPSDAAGAHLYAAAVIAAFDGTDAAGVAPPAGGVGLRGWLSGIYAKLSAPLTVQGTVTVTDGSGPLTVDGTVGLAAGPGRPRSGRHRRDGRDRADGRRRHPWLAVRDLREARRHSHRAGCGQRRQFL